jgi:hypothetical protein
MNTIEHEGWRHEHAVLFINPVANNANSPATEQGLDELRALIPDVQILPTIPNRKENREYFYENVPEGSLIGFVGGDGTTKNGVKDMLSDEAPGHIRNAPVLTMGTGNKNDVTHILHGDAYNRPAVALRQGRIRNVHAMQYNLWRRTDTPSMPEDVDEELALYSLGFRSLGLGADRANDPEYKTRQLQRGRIGQKIADYRLALRVFRDDEQLDVTYGGERKPRLDILCANGDQMAGNWRFPVEIDEAAFYVGILRDKKLRHALRDTIGLLTASLPEGKKVHDALHFNLHERTLAQADGETFYTGPGLVTVSQTPRSVRFLAAR